MSVYRLCRLSRVCFCGGGWFVGPCSVLFLGLGVGIGPCPLLVGTGASLFPAGLVRPSCGGQHISRSADAFQTLHDSLFYTHNVLHDLSSDIYEFVFEFSLVCL